MQENKYSSYFITECIKPKVESWGPVASGFFNMFRITELFPKANVDGSGLYYTRPHVMVNTTHIHDFDEYLFFLGTNVEDINDFDARVELNMGEEGEKHIITSPTIVYVPARLVHCPLNFAVVNKPVLFFHVRDHSIGKSVEA